MKPTGKFNKLTGNEIMEIEHSDIDFWEIPWNELTLEQRCMYLSYRNIKFLNDTNREFVEEFYQIDQLIQTS